MNIKKILRSVLFIWLCTGLTIFGRVNVSRTINKVTNLNNFDENKFKQLRNELAIVRNQIKGESCNDLLRVAARDLQYKQNYFRVFQEFVAGTTQQIEAKKRIEKAQKEDKPITQVNQEENDRMLAQLEQERIERERREHEERELARAEEQRILERTRQAQIEEDIRLAREEERIAQAEEERLRELLTQMNDYFESHLFRELTIDGVSLIDIIAVGGQKRQDSEFKLSRKYSVDEIVNTIQRFVESIDNPQVNLSIQEFYDEEFTKKELQKQVGRAFVAVLRLYDALLSFAYNFVPGGSQPPPRNTKVALEFIQGVAQDIILLVEHFYDSYSKFLTKDYRQLYNAGGLNIGWQEVPFHGRHSFVQEGRTRILIKGWFIDTKMIVPTLSSMHKKDYNYLIAYRFNELNRAFGYNLAKMPLSEGKTIELPEWEEETLIEQQSEELEDEWYSYGFQIFVNLQQFAQQTLDEHSLVDSNNLKAFIDNMYQVLFVSHKLDIYQELREFLLQKGDLLQLIQILDEHISTSSNQKPATAQIFEKFVQEHVGISNFDEKNEELWQELHQENNISKFFEPAAGDSYSVVQVQSVTRYFLMSIFELSQVALQMFIDGMPEEKLQKITDLIAEPQKTESSISQEVVIEEEKKKPIVEKQLSRESHLRTKEALEQVELQKGEKKLPLPEELEELNLKVAQQEKEPNVIEEPDISEPSRLDKMIEIAQAQVEKRTRAIIRMLQVVHEGIATQTFAEIEKTILNLKVKFLGDGDPQVQEWYNNISFLSDNDVSFSQNDIENTFLYICTLFDAVRYRIYQQFNDTPLIYVDDKQAMSNSFLLLPTQEQVNEINRFIDDVQEPLVELINGVFEKWQQWLPQEFNDLYESGNLDILDYYKNDGLPGIVIPEQQKPLYHFAKYSYFLYHFAKYSYFMDEKFCGYRVDFEDEKDVYLKAEENKFKFALSPTKNIEMLLLPAISAVFKKNYDDLLNVLKIGQQQPLPERIKGTKDKKELQQKIKKEREEEEARKSAQKILQSQKTASILEQISIPSKSTRPLYEQAALQGAPKTFARMPIPTYIPTISSTSLPIKDVPVEEETVIIAQQTEKEVRLEQERIRREQELEEQQLQELEEPVEEEFLTIEPTEQQEARELVPETIEKTEDEKFLEKVQDWGQQMRNVLAQTHVDGVVYDHNVETLEEKLENLIKEASPLHFDNAVIDSIGTLLRDFTAQFTKYEDHIKKIEKGWFGKSTELSNQLLSEQDFIKILYANKQKKTKNREFFKQYFETPGDYRDRGNSNRVEADNYAYIRYLQLTLDEIMQNL